MLAVQGRLKLCCGMSPLLASPLLQVLVIRITNSGYRTLFGVFKCRKKKVPRWHSRKSEGGGRVRKEQRRVAETKRVESRTLHMSTFPITRRRDREEKKKEV
ncbi:hypothetical protein F4775DRAFT_562243 [Biscogniauxia sp. FL1348]|nr:hypothetical protein F4775DRAFT_562243 [Biscogniauxia sp. FL1348]